MPTRPMVSEEEYLRMHFDGPDREYVDGEIVERHMGEKRHGRLEAKLAQLLSSLEKSHRFYTVIDTRMKVQARTYRIPDVAVFREEPADVPDTPPLLIIEVLSPDDSFIEV